MAALQDEALIQADPDVVGDLDDENSIGDASSLRESATSLNASIFEYRNIRGRQFQSSKTTDYWAPTDEQHTEAFDLAHHFMLQLFDDKLHLAPIGDQPQRILDIGTGTGIWAIDMADEYPSAEILGTDISAVQPAWVPPNCRFEIDDAQLDWTFPVDHFDFIHVRHLYGAIDNWSKFYTQAFAHTKPGGWFENVDVDIQPRSQNPRIDADPDHVFKKWPRLFYEAGDKIGRTFRTVGEDVMVGHMRAAGFVDIVHRTFKVPTGGWPRDPRMKNVGLCNGMFLDQSLDGYVIYPIGEILGWTFDEVNVLVAQMRHAFRDPKTLPYYYLHAVWGRKPNHAVSPPPAQEKTPSPLNSP